MQHRREVGVTKELVAHGTRGNDEGRTAEERALADKRKQEENETRERMVATRREVEKRMRR